MREIKFRAWDKNSKKMVGEVTKIEFANNREHINSYGHHDVLSAGSEGVPYRGIAVDCEIMQFTGLTDKKGVEIYEGDIVRGKDGLNYKVFWYEEGAQFMFDDFDRTSKGKIGEPLDYDDSEVIGNIHENKELLK